MNKSIPPAPAGWNKTIENLCDEMNRGERSSMGSPEVDWALAYERSQIPMNMRFPRKGDVYEVLTDMSVDYMTSWAAPFSGGGAGILKRGDRVIVDREPVDPKAISVSAIAVDYKEVELRMVPSSDRTSPKYIGFYFSFNTVDLNRKFLLVHEE